MENYFLLPSKVILYLIRLIHMNAAAARSTLLFCMQDGNVPVYGSLINTIIELSKSMTCSAFAGFNAENLSSKTKVFFIGEGSGLSFTASCDVRAGSPTCGIGSGGGAINAKDAAAGDFGTITVSGFQITVVSMTEAGSAASGEVMAAFPPVPPTPERVPTPDEKLFEMPALFGPEDDLVSENDF